MKYAVFNDDLSLQTCLIEGVHPIPASALKIDDSLFIRLIQETDGVWRLVDGEVVKQALPAAVPDYAQLVADERFRREATGVTVAGLQIETTRESAGLVYGAGLSALLDPDYRCNFKTLTGFVEIGAAQIIEIAKAVRTHVQACFDRELALLRAIEAGEYRDDMLSEGWPNSLLPEPVEVQ